MIRTNDEIACPDDGPEGEHDLQTERLHRRNFQKILAACRGFFETVLPDPAAHIATGIYTGVPEECREAWLSYNPEDQSVRLLIRFRKVQSASPAQCLMLVMIQASTKLARFCCDERRDGLTLEAASICPDPEMSKAVVEPLSASLRQVLQDDRLKAIIGS
jgi:hypothetical protein